MTVRIPGPQPTAGLEPYFLDPSPAWMPGPTDSGARLAGETARAIQDISGRDLVPNAVYVADTTEVETGISDAETSGVDRSSAAAGTTARVVQLSRDPTTADFSVVDGGVDRISKGIGSTPDTPGINYPPPPDIQKPPDNKV